MIASTLALLLALAVSPVRVLAPNVEDVCPSGAEVEQALASMLASAAPIPSSRDVAKLERSPGKLRVQLVDSEGAVIGERTLDGQGSCAALGRMAAIVIASWESDVHPEFVRQGAEPPKPAPTAPPPPGAAYDVAAGVSFAQADKPAFGGSLGGAWFPRGVGLGLWLLGGGDTARTLVVGSHEARWRRWTASLEVAERWGRRGFAIDAHGGVMLGWLATEGVDYAQNRSDAAASLGGTAGVRSSFWASRHAALWVDLRGYYFPRPDAVYGTGTVVDEATVPRWGGIASVGVALGRGPVFR